MNAQRFERPAHALHRVVVVSTRFKPAAHPVAVRLAQAFDAAGPEVILDLAGEQPLRDLGADLVVAVGGDGTMLSTARRLVGATTPVVGVNLGKLGFLAAFAADEIERYATGGHAPDWPVSPKMMLEVRLRGDGTPRHALNDVLFTQGVITRLAHLRLSVDGQPASEYRADGLVVSTPVGSTAYSLSLGGPILSQDLRAMVVTPIAPHSLTNRPIVLSGLSVLGLELLSAVDEMALVLDGQERLDLRHGDRIEVRAAPDALQLVASERSAFEVLRLKLRWGEGPGLSRDESSGDVVA